MEVVMTRGAGGSAVEAGARSGREKMTSPCARSRVATPPTPMPRTRQKVARSVKSTPLARSHATSAAIWCAEPSPAPGAPRVPNERARVPSQERRRCRLPNREGEWILDQDDDARTTRASRPRHPGGARDVQDIEGAAKSRERNDPDAATRMSKCPCRGECRDTCMRHARASDDKTRATTILHHRA